jgi:hypothetical protein
MPSGDSDRAQTQEAVKRTRRFTVLTKWSASEFLISLLLVIVVTPFVEDLNHGPLIEGCLVTFMLTSAVLAVSDRRRTLLVALSLALLAVAGRWAQHFWPNDVPAAIYLIAGLALLSFVLVQYLRYILSAPVVTFVVLCAAVSTYLMLGLLWTLAYVLVATIQLHAFAIKLAGERAERHDRVQRVLLQLCDPKYGWLR